MLPSWVAFCRDDTTSMKLLFKFQHAASMKLLFKFQHAAMTGGGMVTAIDSDVSHVTDRHRDLL
jgi:hypothetical protein